MKQRILRKLDQLVFSKWRALLTLVRRTNVRRWAKNIHEVPTWDARNRVIAELVPPGITVMDIGAGAQTMRQHLKGIALYTPCDLFQTTPDTLICDFNRGILPQVPQVHDLAICSGVLEYVCDEDIFFKFVTKWSRGVILSYNVRLPDDSKVDRLAKDWVNHFSLEEIRKIVASHGWRIAKEIHSSPKIPQEMVFVLERAA
jgi:hypothetical protein